MPLLVYYLVYCLVSAPSDLPTPEDSEFWHILPCIASTVRNRNRSSITLNKNSARAFQRAIYQGSTMPLTSTKLGSKCRDVSSFGDFDNKGRKVCCKVSLYKNCPGKVVAQSIAFRVVSIYWQGDDPLSLKSCLQVTCPLLSMVFYGRCQNS